MRLTLGEARGVIARALKLCPTDAIIPDYLNEAQQRLINKNKWQGTFQRYQFCVNSECITLPRQIQTIEAWAMCNAPGVVRNQWYEFSSNGYGLLRQHDLNGLQLLDRGDGFVTFNDLPRDGSNKLRVYADRAEVSGSKLLVQGYDQDGNWVQTTALNGATIEGEYIAISVTPTNSVNYFKTITGIIKPLTNGTVRLYGYNPSTAGQIALGYYENDETTPSYRRCFVPGMTTLGSCCNNVDTETCNTKQITVMAKLRHIPVANDNDWLIVGNVYALKDMCMAIAKSERDLFNEAQAYESKAVQLLEEELSAYLGDGMVSTVKVQGAETWGGGGVLNYT